jgi:alanyl-tRNA synthetase
MNSELENKLVRYESDEFFALMTVSNGRKIVCEPVPTGDAKKVGAIARELVTRGIDIAAMFTRDGNVAVATKKGIDAKNILEKIIEFAGGSGGGGQEFAQGAKVNLEEFKGIRKAVASV